MGSVSFIITYIVYRALVDHFENYDTFRAHIALDLCQNLRYLDTEEKIEGRKNQ